MAYRARHPRVVRPIEQVAQKWAPQPVVVAAAAKVELRSGPMSSDRETTVKPADRAPLHSKPTHRAAPRIPQARSLDSVQVPPAHTKVLNMHSVLIRAVT